MRLDYPSPVLNLQAAAAAPKLIRASKTFTGAANLGAVGTAEVFTVTGQILIDTLVVFCSTGLAEAAPTATIALGVQFSTTRYITTTNAVDIDTNQFWQGGAGSGAVGPIINIGTGETFGPGAGTDGKMILTIGAQAITGGVLEFYALYRPLSSDGALTLGAGMTAI